MSQNNLLSYVLIEFLICMSLVMFSMLSFINLLFYISVSVKKLEQRSDFFQLTNNFNSCYFVYNKLDLCIDLINKSFLNKKIMNNLEIKYGASTLNNVHSFEIKWYDQRITESVAILQLA